MSGSVTVADSSLLLLDWGRLDCLKEGGVGGDETEAKQTRVLKTGLTAGGQENQSEGALTRLPVEGSRPPLLRPSVSANQSKTFF